ncbi:hypothetical protein PV646_43885 [Streptomyces sp. ID05-26A]|nr:hypothetical protein [Streptomyces sp. ID05-26A]
MWKRINVPSSSETSGETRSSAPLLRSMPNPSTAELTVTEHEAQIRSTIGLTGTLSFHARCSA